jgi:hypothetical protein
MRAISVLKGCWARALRSGLCGGVGTDESLRWMNGVFVVEGAARESMERLTMLVSLEKIGIRVRGDMVSVDEADNADKVYIFIRGLDGGDAGSSRGGFIGDMS